QMLGDSKTKRITALIRSVVENSREGTIAMDPATYQAYTELEAFMYQAVYLNEYAKKEERKVPHIIQSLFVHFRNPDHLPDYMQKIAEEEGVDTASCDYVAGMTDHYAVACYQELFIPKAWNLGLGH
ncbi:MAG: deoxyguanosinetriphosphate triphosphohydrolase, partial [Acutalibacter sp.]